MQGYQNYKWIVADPDLFGGKLTIRGTRLTVSFLLGCLAEGMTVEEIRNTYGDFPEEAIAETLRVAATQLENPVVAA